MIRRYLSIFILALYVPASLRAQDTSGVLFPGRYATAYTAADCFKNPRYSGRFRPDTLKLNYVLRGQRIWRSISLDNEQNRLLLNNSRKCTELGLFEVIKFGLLEKELNAFSSDDLNKAAQSRLAKADILKLITFRDTSQIVSFDANGNQTVIRQNINRYRMGSDIKSYLLKEDWIFNSNTGKTEKYIIAIAPLVFDPATEKTVPLFWLYYPEWKELFASFEAKNLYSYGVLSFHDVFRRRYFVSQISKQSNIFDRSVKEVNHGQDAYLESELIKERLSNTESDLFDH